MNNLIIHKSNVDVICSHRTSAGCDLKAKIMSVHICPQSYSPPKSDLKSWTFSASVCSPGPAMTLRQATLMVWLVHSDPVIGCDACCSMMSLYAKKNILQIRSSIQPTERGSSCGKTCISLWQLWGKVTPSTLMHPVFTLKWRCHISTYILMCLLGLVDHEKFHVYSSLDTSSQIYSQKGQRRISQIILLP